MWSEEEGGGGRVVEELTWLTTRPQCWPPNVCCTRLHLSRVQYFSLQHSTPLHHPWLHTAVHYPVMSSAPVSPLWTNLYTCMWSVYPCHVITIPLGRVLLYGPCNFVSSISLPPHSCFGLILTLLTPQTLHPPFLIPNLFLFQPNHSRYNMKTLRGVEEEYKEGREGGWIKGRKRGCR